VGGGKLLSGPHCFEWGGPVALAAPGPSVTAPLVENYFFLSLTIFSHVTCIASVIRLVPARLTYGALPAVYYYYYYYYHTSLIFLSRLTSHIISIRFSILSATSIMFSLPSFALLSPKTSGYIIPVIEAINFSLCLMEMSNQFNMLQLTT
jgi:hypothetical protein